MKKILIIFPDEWLSYSPTILNLVDALSRHFKLSVLAFDNALYDNSALTGDTFTFIHLPKQISRVLFALGLYKPLKAVLLLRHLKDLDADEVIAVDSLALWCATRRWGAIHFLSLEINHDYFFRRVKQTQIKSVIIQTAERYQYLFDDESIPCFYIQNAPPFVERPRPAIVKDNYEAIVFGNLIPRHGVYLCLDALKHCDNVRLTLKGRITPSVKRTISNSYGELIRANRLVIDDAYLKQSQLIDYLSKFHFGFCLYDFRLIRKGDFNYMSVPSGKLFYYYAAGVPVIGSDIIGLSSIKTFNTGITLERLSPKTIANAIQDIIAQHDLFRDNCLAAAQHFDFNRALKPFTDYLRETRDDEAAQNPEVSS